VFTASAQQHHTAHAATNFVGEHHHCMRIACWQKFWRRDSAEEGRWRQEKVGESAGLECQH
jgi:hypothetical protein